METVNIKEASYEEVFSIEIVIGKPIVVGKDDIVERCQLIPILSRIVKGQDFKDYPKMFY